MIRALALLCVLVMVSATAFAQSLKKGQLSGTLISASGTAPIGGSQGPILTTPASGAFVLTQICTAGTPSANNEDYARVVGSTFGTIAQSYGTDTVGACTTYTPGVALPPGEELSCVQIGASGSAVTCTVTGVVSKK